MGTANNNKDHGQINDKLVSDNQDKLGLKEEVEENKHGNK